MPSPCVFKLAFYSPPTMDSADESAAAEVVTEKIAKLLNISKEEVVRILNQAFIQEDPFSSLSDLLGYSNIDLIFETYKFKDAFIEKEYKNEHVLFVEHVIPESPSIYSNGVPADKLVKTSALGDDSKYFPYEAFNPVQSAVFRDIHGSDGNVLVAAPTGAGKTDIALVGILRALRHNGSQIIYVAPMKALASEIHSKYSKLLGKQHLVVEYTGDTEVDRKIVSKARIVICTPEKFDVATRKLCCAFQNIRLVVIDEIHMLEDDRGPVIESIVARMFKVSELKQTFIRIIGLSATLPNYQDVAAFIKAQHVHFFGQEYRPVPLKMTVTGFTKIAKHMDEMNYLLGKTQEFINRGKQVLIFVHSRAKTYKIANFLAQNLPQNSGGGDVASWGTEGIRKHTKKLSNELDMLASKSVGVHHAGLSRLERSQMETLFIQGTIRTLVTTSTLAWGVNLPAYAVIIHGHMFYNPHLGQFSDVSILDVLQIFGRAGRPQYDSKGEAILIVTANKLDQYVGLLKRNRDIESKMLFHVPESLNSEIYLNHVTSIATALGWIKNTFLYVRMMKNPEKYGVLSEEVELEEQALSEYIYLTVKRLEDCRLVSIDRKDSNYNTWTFRPTFYGQVSSIYYLSHLTMYTWLGGIDSANDEASLISLLLRSEEFKSISIRREEIGYLNALHEDLLLNSMVSFEFDETSESKLLILLISFLCFKKMQVFSLSCDTDFVVENMKRLIAGMHEILLHLKRYDLFLVAFLLEKKIHRLKQQTAKNVLVRGVRISNDFVDFQIKTMESSTVFFFDKGVPFYAFQTSQSTSHVFRCDVDRFTVKVHTNNGWSTFEGDVDLAYDYSPSGLYRYGVHCCDSLFYLAGKRTSCVHFQDKPPAHKIESPSLDQKLKYVKDETYNNVVSTFFKIIVNFVEIKSNHFKERLRLMSNQISNARFDSILIVCPSNADARETQMFLNTQAALENHFAVEKYEVGSKPGKNNKLWICSFKEALGIVGFEAVILKGAGNVEGIFPIFEVFSICSRRRAVVYDSPENIEYLKSVMPGSAAY